eukprot:GHVN01050476.1.p1 GENE.GHVN01050476.1~~GHVN01050476.1.p1  ORF type:complete len:754 (-),score=21.28 GHVN01050476.1:2702-4963(-)
MEMAKVRERSIRSSPSDEHDFCAPEIPERLFLRQYVMREAVRWTTTPDYTELLDLKWQPVSLWSETSMQYDSRSRRRYFFPSVSSGTVVGIAAAVGLGNFVNFPQLAVSYNGPIFLVPYLVTLCLFSACILQLEVSVGYLAFGGPAKAYDSLSHSSKGLFFFIVLQLLRELPSYSAIVTHLIRYQLAALFRGKPPWSPIPSPVDCTSFKSEASCFGELACFWTASSQKCVINILSEASKFAKEVTNKTPISEEVTFNYVQCILLLFVMVVVFGFLYCGFRAILWVAVGAIGLTVSFMAVVLVELLQFPGVAAEVFSMLGTWDFAQLLNIDLWVSTLNLTIFSLSLGLASFAAIGGKVRLGENVLHVAWGVMAGDMIVSLLAMVVSFGMISVVETEMGVAKEDVLQFDIVFEIIPVATSYLSAGTVYSFIYFLVITLFSLIVLSVSYIGIVTSLQESKKFGGCEPFVMPLVVSSLNFLASLTYVFSFGGLIAGFMGYLYCDSYTVVFLECVITAWISRRDQCIGVVGLTAVRVVEIGSVSALGLSIAPFFLVQTTFLKLAVVGGAALLYTCSVSVAFWMSGKKNPNQHTSKERLTCLVLGSAEYLRRDINSIAASYSCNRLTLYWGLSVRFFVPFVLFFLHLTSYRALYDSSAYIGGFIAGVGYQFVGFGVVLLGVLFVNFFEWSTPPVAEYLDVTRLPKDDDQVSFKTIVQRNLEILREYAKPIPPEKLCASIGGGPAFYSDESRPETERPHF